MQTLSLNARLISAVIAAATTLSLFSTVVSLAEPQRSVLIAQNQRTQKLHAAPVSVAIAPTSVSRDDIRDGK